MSEKTNFNKFKLDNIIKKKRDCRNVKMLVNLNLEIYVNLRWRMPETSKKVHKLNYKGTLDVFC